MLSAETENTSAYRVNDSTEGGGPPSTIPSIQQRRSGRSRKPFRPSQLLPSLSSSSSSETRTSETDDDERMSIEVQVDAPSSHTIGDFSNRLESIPGHRLLYDHFTSGTALKLVLDEWINGWRQSPHPAALQLLNFVLFVSDIEGPLMRASDLDVSDPAATLTNIQRSWTIRSLSDRAHYHLLSPRNKCRPAKQMKANYRDWWSRWAKLMASQQLAQRIVLNWLLTMSTSGYRVLRHAATLAAFSILSGAAQEASQLARQLDRAHRLARHKNAMGKEEDEGDGEKDDGEKQVDALGRQLAEMEQVMQMIFDAVFVQRFRDVEPIIRVEAVTFLGQWIEAYPEVFLDNSYLRYIGWALSDRVSSVREQAIESFMALIRVATLRSGMAAFIQRFRPRIIDMAARDVEGSVRVMATQVCALLLRYTLAEGDEEEIEEIKESMAFLITRIILRQPLGKETLLALAELIFGEADVSPLGTFEVTSVPFMESKGFLLSIQLLKFLSSALDLNDGNSLQAVVDHFVYEAKREWPFLRDFSNWISMLDVVLSSKAKGLVRDISSSGMVEMVLRVTEAVARYSVVFVNSTPLELKQRGIDRFLPHQTHSRDLASTLTGKISNWMEGLGRIPNVPLSSFFELLVLCDGPTLLTDVNEGGMNSSKHLIEGLGALSLNITPSSIDDFTSLVKLLSYWQKTGHKMASELIDELVAEDIKEVCQWAERSIGEINWSEAMSTPWWWARLPSWVANGCCSRENVQLGRDIHSLLQKVLTTLSMNEQLTEEMRNCLENAMAPLLLRALIFVDPQLGFIQLGDAHVYRYPVLCCTAIELLEDISEHVTTFLGDKGEAQMIQTILKEFTGSNSQEGRLNELMVEALFRMAYLWTNRKVDRDMDFTSSAVAKAAFTQFDLFAQDALGIKCFTLLWGNVITNRSHSEVVNLAREILLTRLELVNEQFLENTVKLAKILADPLRNLTIPSELLIEFHCRMVGLVKDKEGSLIDALLVSFAPLLSANLAAEQLAIARKTILEARGYIKALEKAVVASSGTKRTGITRKGGRNNLVTGNSRLREQVSSILDSDVEGGREPLSVVDEEDGEDEDVKESGTEREPTRAMERKVGKGGKTVKANKAHDSEGLKVPVDNFMKIDDEQSLVDAVPTPIREMEGLRMSSSDLNLPSSPLQTRKRVIRL